MRAEVIAIGDELTSGQRLDTNSQWLSQQLSELGVEVLYHTTVGDDLTADTKVFRAAMRRADVVVVTGGLGPTADDLTREALAAALDTELQLHEPSLDHIRQLFASRGRAMPERNERQAFLPRGAGAIPNPHGTAPGIHAVAPGGAGGRCHLFALPGVPAEMQEMWQATVAPAIAALQPAAVIRHRAIKLFGPGESQLEAMLPDLIRRGREPRVGITASAATLTLRVTATAMDEAGCHAQIESTVQEIYAAAGNFVFGEGEDELEHVVLRLLRDRGATLATHEQLTKGLLASWLTEADTLGDTYCGGFVARASESDVAEAAETTRARLGATYGLAIGPATPSGKVEIALADGGSVERKSFSLGGHPAVLGPRIAKAGLNWLRLRLGALSD